MSAKGQLVHAATGAPLLGWSAETDVAGATPAHALSVPLGHFDAVRATSLIHMRGNLNANSGAGQSFSSPVRVYDALGEAHDLTIVFGDQRMEDRSDPTSPPAARSSWSWSAYEGGDAWTGVPIGSSSTPGNARLSFDDTGAPVSPAATGTGSGQTVLVPPSGRAASLTIRVDFAGIEQLQNTSQVTLTSQDGFPAGTLQGYEIEGDGTIVGLFTSGLTKPLGRVALARFYRPETLRAIGNGLARPTNLSGLARLDAPQSEGLGSVVTREVGE